MRRDLFLIERAIPLRAREEIVSLVCRRLPAHYERRPGRATSRCSRRCTAASSGSTPEPGAARGAQPRRAAGGGGRLRIGDKLMMTGRNLHELGLMNGTLLRLLDEIGPTTMTRRSCCSSEGAIFRLPPEEAERLRLGLRVLGPSRSGDRAAGGGDRGPSRPAGAFFLRREMLYTAVTRAKLATVIVGTREVIARAARTPDTGRRHSRLAERLA